MSQIFQKIAQWLATELVTKRLASSQTFMDAARKTHQGVKQGKGLLKDGHEKLANEGVPLAAEKARSTIGFIGEVLSHLTGSAGKK